MYVFEVLNYDDQLIGIEEMKPKWFLKEETPYDEMGLADRNWMPICFAGKDFRGCAIFDCETKAFIESSFNVKDDSNSSN